MSRDGPVPLFANGGGTARVGVTFSENLTPGILNPANWSIRWLGFSAPPTGASVAAPGPGAVVQLVPGLGVPDPGPDAVTFTPPPFDVTALVDSAPAQGFVGFPLV